MIQRLIFLAILLGVVDQPLWAVGEASKEALVVVATRYLQPKGVSHAHLYLYKEDGTFLRQLTKFSKGQDHDPLFSNDGKEIVFAHTPDGDDEGGKAVVEAKSPASVEYWTVETADGRLKRLSEVPNWYRTATNADRFTQSDPKDWPTNTPVPGMPDKGWDKNFSDPPTQAEIDSLPVTKVMSPDSVFELNLKMETGDVSYNGSGNGKLYELKNLKSGKSWRLGDLSGFFGLTDLLHEASNPEHLFLQHDDLNVVFFSLHMGSSFGEACIALNLNKPSLLMLPGHQVVSHDDGKLPATDNEATWKACMDNSGNATPIPLPGEPYFLVLGENRYEPIPKSDKTANISYLTRFDATLRGMPYIRLHSAPIFYGASLYRPGASPDILKIGESIDRD